MRPVIYIDTLFLVNLIFNILIFYLSSYILKKDISILRIFSVGAVGALYGVFMFFPELKLLYTGIFKLIFTAFSAWLLFMPKSVKLLIKYTIVCLFVSIGFCGSICLCLFLFGAAPKMGLVISKGIIYLDIDPVFLAFGVIISLFVLIFFSSAREERNILKDEHITELIVYKDKYNFKVKALIDTGCSLFDQSGRLPCLIVENGLIPKELETVEKSVLKYSTVTKENEELQGFIPDYITDKEGKFYLGIVAVGRENLDFKERFNGVVNPEIFNRRFENEKVV